MSEPPSSDNAVIDQPKSASDVADMFNLPDVEAPEKEEKESKEKPEKPEKEDDDEGVEIKEPEEEVEKLDLKDEEIEIETPPRKKEILAKYPNLFKDFPFVEKLMFRDRQYTELFGSFDDAKEAASRASVLDEFEQDLLRGNTEKILHEVKRTDAKAFDRIIDNYLPTLARVDKEAYFEVVGNIGKQIISQLANEAKTVYPNNKEQGEVLNGAALVLNQFLFGSSTYTPPKQRVAEQRDAELESERINFTRERFTTARDDLQTKVDNTLKATISEYIDPKGEMTSYVKRNAVRDALLQLHGTVGQDTNFRRNLDRLWESAFSDKFSQNSLNRIRSAYLGKSKQLLSTIIKKARADALKDTVPSARKAKEEEEEETPRKRGIISAGRPHQTSGKMKMEKGETVLDFLSRD